MGKLDLNLNFYFMEAMNFNSKLYVCSLPAWLAVCLLVGNAVCALAKFINSITDFHPRYNSAG